VSPGSTARRWVVTLMAGLPVLASGAAWSGERTLAIRNARLLTVAGSPVPRGVIVVQGERIDAVGADLAIPRGAEVVEGEGLTVCPGFFDAFTAIGLVEIAQVASTNDLEEPVDPITPHLRAADAYFLDSEVIPVVRAAGTTVLLAAPGPSNVISGQSALMRTAGETLEEAAVRPVAALHLNLGEPPKAAHGSRGRSPTTRMGTAALLRQAFARARDYLARPEPRPRDLKLEPLAEAIQGKLPVVARAERRSDILVALGLAQEFGFRLILAGASDAPLLAEELARRKVPVLIAVDQQPDSLETLGARYENPARLRRAGVTIAFQSNEVTLARNLVPNVGLAVAHGLPEAEALRALTLSPAEIFGVEDRLGSLEPGKEATFVLTRGDPLQVRSRVIGVFIRGRRFAPRSYQTELCERHIAPRMAEIPCQAD
jgi:imidazolonepropionase-like amidohydrolase